MAAEQFFTNTLLVVMILVSAMLFVHLLDAFIMSIQAHRAAKKFDKMVTSLIEELKAAAKEKAGTKKEEQPVEEEVVKPDYKAMTIGELKNIAKERKIKGYYNLKKADLVKVLSK